MAKILKNKTGSPINLSVLGLPNIPANSQITIQSFDYLLLASSDSVNYLTPLINAGSIVVNDGFADLVPGSALRLINIDLVSKISDADTGAGRLQDKIVSGVGVTVQKLTNSQTGEQTLSFNTTEAFEGKGFQVSYIGNGTVGNQWIQQEDQNIISNQVPDIFKYQARLVGVDYSNSNRGTDPIIIFCIKNAGAQNLNGIDRLYKWTITNARSSVKTNTVDGFIVNPGDLMAIYVRDGGGNPNDMVLSMDFIVLDATPRNITTNISGDFSSNDIPETNLIPEIFT